MPWWIQIDEKTAPFSYVVVDSVAQPADAYNTLPYPTQAAADSEAATLNGNAKKGVAGSLESGAAAAGGDVLNDALKPLFQASIWIRVAEVVAGLILLGIGLNAMLKGKPLSVVTGTAGTLGKAAML
jgi:hypothetical protein